MKKCLIFFTLLLLTIAFAIIMQQNERLPSIDEVVINDVASDDLLVEDKTLALDYTY
ncbi:hypothetical protein [Muriicola sp. Z0-33]|uniref:hypothetical protein n=1 Tax=Muriicola sp. Z0-33 TaxID=2816957 RepID=UPI002238A9E1|nr:hypothetical protein [Muriicola sp. Z0-33]MCW5516400.1 hypothetical protein [Muriicola sp. Z0-33]